MKRKEIIVLLGEVLGSRAAYSIASIAITVTMLSGITIILRNDIRDIKNYIQSVVDGDPKYKEVHEQVSGSENVIRGSIDIKALAEVEDEKSKETATTNSNISEGYDNYTPTQTVTGESSNKPSNIANNSSVNGETSSGTNSNNNHLNNVNNVNTNTNNSSDSQKEEIADRSSFNGKDVMISEGEPFNPMNALQLAATDINGKNITNKIVITENNVDTYKPGLYTVKANVTLSNENTLEKEFLVRVEPTILNLAVNDLKISKDVLEKNEHFNLTFAVKSSKSYLEVASVNINNEDYVVNKTSSSSFFRTSNKYEVDLVAPSKAGTEKIEIKSVTMSDGTIVDINKSVNVKILKEEAHIIDAVVKNITSEDEDMFLEYNLEDVDNVLNEAFLYLYDENDALIQQEELEKNNKSSINLNINENGKYKVQIKGYYKTDINTRSDFSNEKELFTQRIEVNKFNGDNIISSENNDISDEEDLMLMYMENEEDYNEINHNISEKERAINSTIQIGEEKTHQIEITGSIADYNGNFPPSTIQVVVPTTANFTVDKDGNFINSIINITNNGDESIDIVVQRFIDVNGSVGINVQGKDVIDKNNISRSNISLNINGNRGTAYLGSDNSKLGVYSDPNLSNNTNDGILVSTIYRGSTGKLTLNGEASKGSEDIDNPIQDRFTLILKIKKSENN